MRFAIAILTILGAAIALAHRPWRKSPAPDGETVDRDGPCADCGQVLKIGDFHDCYEIADDDYDDAGVDIDVELPDGTYDL